MHTQPSQGFTLLELIVSIGILSLLVMLGLTSLLQSRNVREVATQGHNALTTLRAAQSKTLAAENNAQWGVRFENDRFILFRGTSFATASYTAIYTLPSYLEISDMALAGGGQEVVFNRLNGKTNQPGSFKLRARASSDIAFSIAIDGSGQAYESGATLPTSGARITDARHRAFNLGWSIKNALILTLTFSDPAQVSSVIMAPFFNTDKTKFDWTGTVTVGGIDQTLRIHTTSLTDANTLISIDRDCRTNTKKVVIAIDGNTIATYETDCRTITVGPSGGTMTEP